MNHQSISGAYNWEGIGVLGFHAIMTDVGDIAETKVSYLYADRENGIYNPGLTGRTVSPSSMVIGLSFARNITDKFAFGLTAKWAREDLVEASASQLVLDGGLTFNTGWNSLVIAAAIRHFGAQVKFIDESYPLPQTLTLGAAAFLISPDESFLLQVNDHKLLAAFDMVEARDYGQQYHLGMEYTMYDLLSLRAGYKFNYDEEGPSFGVGFTSFNFRIEYSYSDFGSSLGSVQRFTIGFLNN
jgi:hypothetical protein